MFRGKYVIFYTGIIFFFCALTICEAKPNIKLGNSSTWTVTINSVAAPGLDVTNEFYTGDTDYYWSIFNAKKNAGIRLDMERDTASWNSDIHIYVIRLTAGDGPGVPSGGTTYQEITSSTTTFFSTTDTCPNIYFKYRMDGVTAGVLAATTYTTTITYTGVDI